MIRITEPEGYSKYAISIYKSLGKVAYGWPNRDDLLTEVLVVKLGTFIGENVLNKFPNLNYIITPTTGLTHIDLQAIKQKGIKVFSLKDLVSKIDQIKSTSELTLALSIMINRNFGLYMGSIASGKQDIDREYLKGKEISVQTLGIVGLGRIGMHLYSYSAHLWGKTIGWDINPLNLMKLPLSDRTASLENLLQISDTVCLCVDLNKYSRRMINRDSLLTIKKGASIVNTSRGEIVDEEEIARAIINGKLFGYATDVLDSELSGSMFNSNLWKLSQNYNILITPHIGGCTLEAMDKTEILMAKYLREKI